MIDLLLGVFLCGSKPWWTRTQTIRTLAQVPLDVIIRESEEIPAYQEIAHKALHLSKLGFSDSTIARYLKVSDKTVRKAIKWILMVTH